MMTDQALDQIQEAVEQLDFPELQKAARIIEKEQKRREKEARKQAQQEMKMVAQKYGLDLEEIVSGVAKGGSGAKGGKVPPKFRHPEDPSKTWTGRGRKPVWIKEWEAQGGDVEELRIPET